MQVGRFVAAILTAALLTTAVPVHAQQQPVSDPLLGQFGAIVEVAPPPPEAARLANLFSTSLASLAPQRRRRQDVYLVVASLWDDPVFEREAVQAEAILRAHLGAEGRSIILSAGGQGQRQYPAATPTNISAAIGHVASIMDPNEDLFVLFVTSHGTADGAASLRERNRLDASLRPISLSAMLSQANIRNRVVIISACFAGAFIPPLQDGNTIVLAAAAADRTSFGCQPQRDWTYFGDAYFNRALRNGASMLEGFERAKSQISTWETEQHLTPSNPQSSIGANAAAMLQRAEREAR
jgi:hypothetical protein